MTWIIKKTAPISHIWIRQPCQHLFTIHLSTDVWLGLKKRACVFLCWLLKSYIIILLCSISMRLFKNPWSEKNSVNGRQFLEIHSWAGGRLWPFASQHLSSAVSVSSLSFHLPLSQLGSAVQQLSLSLSALLLHHVQDYLAPKVFLLNCCFCASARGHTPMWAVTFAPCIGIHTDSCSARQPSSCCWVVLSWVEELGVR